MNLKIDSPAVCINLVMGANLMRFFFVFVIFYFSFASASASDLCPSVTKENSWSKECFEQFGFQLRVKDKYLNNIVKNGVSRSVIFIRESFELVAVDASGSVVLRNIYHTEDYDYPDANLNIGRYAVNSGDHENVLKCGYFDGISLTVVVPAIYDNCSPFQEGFAEVCIDCVKYCTEPECQSSVFLGGNGFIIDGQGKISRSYNMRTLDNICNETDRVELLSTQGNLKYLRCSQTSVQKLPGDVLMMPNLPPSAP